MRQKAPASTSLGKSIKIKKKSVQWYRYTLEKVRLLLDNQYDFGNAQVTCMDDLKGSHRSCRMLKLRVRGMVKLVEQVHKPLLR